jgi:hypothetical protein
VDDAVVVEDIDALNSLCLYDWREQPWKESRHLHDTIIPWTAEWLLYYEIYKMTGKWIGRSVLHWNPASNEGS